MNRLLCAIACALMFAGVAHAQSSVVRLYAGEWTLAFTQQSNSSEPNMKPTPWMTFSATVVQLDSTIGGAMRSSGPTGQFGCKIRDRACSAGRMRLSWDEQDWQVFEFQLDPGSSAKGTGRAQIRFPDGVVHTYSFVMTRA